MAEEYDFLVVGGGTAGCLLASRLASTASKPSVAVLETGEHNNAISLRRTYDRFSLLFTQPTLDYGYVSIPQAGLGGREIPQNRGRGLGGSSQINFQVWSLGAKDEFDHWAAEVGDKDFAFESVLHRIKGFERLHDASLEQFGSNAKPNPQNHGYEGDIDVSIGPYLEKEMNAIFDAGLQLGHRVNLDINSGDPIGFGFSFHSSWEGRRTTSASAFISGKSWDTDNLSIFTNSRVIKVLLKEDHAVGVQLESGKQFFAKKEVILTAGAIDSPRLLLLSGIGPKVELGNLGITVAKDLPGVGKGLTDHPIVFLTLLMNPDFSDRLKFGVDEEVAASEQWMRDGTGPLVKHYSNIALAFLKSDVSYQTNEFKKLPQDIQELLKKPTVPSYEFAMGGPLLPPTYEFEDSKDSYFEFFVALQNSQSRGELKLKSANPADAPLISPNYLSHQYDITVMTDGVREALKFIQTPAIKKYYKHGIYLPVSSSDGDIQDFLKQNIASLWHSSGTAKMGRKENKMSVVASDLKVHGYNNLRVADMSVTPILPSGHAQIVAYTIAAIAAEKIIREHGL